MKQLIRVQNYIFPILASLTLCVGVRGAGSTIKNGSKKENNNLKKIIDEQAHAINQLKKETNRLSNELNKLNHSINELIDKEDLKKLIKKGGKKNSFFERYPKISGSFLGAASPTGIWIIIYYLICKANNKEDEDLESIEEKL